MPHFIFEYFQVGILGNAADFYEDGSSSTSSTLDNNLGRRQMMIAFDMRYIMKNKLISRKRCILFEYL